MSARLEACAPLGLHARQPGAEICCDCGGHFLLSLNEKSSMDTFMVTVPLLMLDTTLNWA